MLPVQRNCIAALLSMMAFGACTSPEPLDNIVVAENPESFNYVTSLQRASSQPEVFHQAGYYIVFDEDAREANITISNLVVEPGQAPLTLTFEGVPMDYTPDSHNTQRIIKADALVSSDPVNSGTTITDVTIIHSQANDMDPHGYSGLFASYCIENRYRVVSFPYHIFLEGTTRVDNYTDTLTSIDYDATYRVQLDPASSTATLKVCGLRIGERQATDFIIPGLELSLCESGFTAAQAGSVEVTLDGHRATVSQVYMQTSNLNQLKLTMNVSVDRKNISVDGFLTAYHTHK